jgi:signal transduction histidine kinase
MTLLNDLLDLSKLEAGEMEFYKEPQNLFVIVQNCLEEQKAWI